jgi:hypothetical protein
VAGGGGIRWKRASDGVSVVGEVDAGGGMAWIWILGRRKSEMGGKGAVRLGEKMGRGEGKCDLKTVHAGLKSSTFECT